MMDDDGWILARQHAGNDGLVMIDCSGLIVKHWLKNSYLSLLRSFIGFGTLKDDRVFY